MPPGQCSTGLEWGLHGIFGGGGVGSSIALTLISSSSVELAGMPSRATSPAENSEPFSLDFSCLCPDPVLVKVILFIENGIAKRRLSLTAGTVALRRRNAEHPQAVLRHPVAPNV